MGVVNLVVLACVLRATTKKSRHFFGGGRKVHPTEKILATPMTSDIIIIIIRHACVSTNLLRLYFFSFLRHQTFAFPTIIVCCI